MTDPQREERPAQDVDTAEIRDCFERDAYIASRSGFKRDMLELCDALDTARAEIARLTAERDRLQEVIATWQPEIGQAMRHADTFGTGWIRFDRTGVSLYRTSNPDPTTVLVIDGKEAR